MLVTNWQACSNELKSAGSHRRQIACRAEQFSERDFGLAKGLTLRLKHSGW
jgi:hypothetical protein